MLKILLIDDEEQVLDMISIRLNALGYHVVKARDGEEGIRKFDEFSFDVVITDFSMPLVSGDEVARHVRNTGRCVPVIGITANSWGMDSSCFDAVLQKPFSLKELTEHIKKVETIGKMKLPAESGGI